MYQEISEYRLVEAGANLPPPYGFKRNIHMSIDDIDKLRKKYNNTGIYITAYRSKTGDLRNDEIYSDLYFDFDKEGDFEAVREDALFTMSWLKTSFGVPYELPRIYFSGNKGVHIIVDGSYLGIKPAKMLNRLFKTIASDVKYMLPNKTLDTVIYDSVRLFRVVNSIHQKTGYYKIPITYEELESTPYEAILEMAKKPRPEFPVPRLPRNRKAESIIDTYTIKFRQQQQEIERKKALRAQNPIIITDCPPCIEEILSNGALLAGRNETCMALVSYYKQTGVRESEALEKALNWNYKVLTDPMEDEEVIRCVNQVYMNGYVYGCGKLQEVANCNKKECPLHNKKKKEEEPDLVSYSKEQARIDDIEEQNKEQEQDELIIHGRKYHDYEIEMLNIIEEVEEFNWARGELGGFTFGEELLDEAFSGLQPALYIIAGQPNIGKSMLALRLAWNVALLNKDAYVLYFAIDDPLFAIMPRVISMDQKIPINVAKIPQMFQDDDELMSKRETGVQRLRENVGSFKILDKSHGYTIEAIKRIVFEHQAKIENAKTGKKLVVFIDNLYDVEVEDQAYAGDTQKKLQKIAIDLDDICEIHKIPVVCTGELKKLNGARRPILDDLKETVKLQYVASAIMLCYNEVQVKGERANVYHLTPEKGEEKQPVLEVHVAKNKLGEYKGRIFYNMYPGYSVLEPLSKEQGRKFTSMMQI